MYNNTIIQTNYKPYIPPPKKKVDKNNADKQPENKNQVVTPNNYNESNQQKQSSSDAFVKNPLAPSKINISQLLIDFNSTLNAIGATEDVESEVKTYLGLVEKQSQKEVPNKKMIISNLKIAADILDTYISDTLKKPSKVVKDWVDALLLQNIDFKADPTIKKGAFETITGEAPQTEKLAEEKLARKTQNSNQQSPTEAEVQVTAQEAVIQEEPVVVVSAQNEKTIELIKKADNYLALEPQKALSVLSEAFVLAQNDADKTSMAQIYSKIAQAQNSMNNLSQALDCLHASTTLAYALGDNLLKTQNHKQMGKIYDEAGFMDTAISHYFASLGIDGELDDTDNQADTLNGIGKMYTSQYVKDDAIDYYKDALELAKVNKNFGLMGDIFKNTALTFGNSGENTKALDNYKNAALLSKKANNNENLSDIYEQAGDLMVKMNHLKKAGDFYKKSYRIAQKLEDDNSLDRLTKKLQLI